MGDAHDHGDFITDPELDREWRGEAAGRTRGGTWFDPSRRPRLSTLEWLAQQKQTIEADLALFDVPTRRR